MLYCAFPYFSCSTHVSPSSPTPQPSPASSASGGSPGDPKKQLREPVRVSQAGPQSKALEEVDSPALGAATLQPRSHSTPYRPLSATLPRGASASQEAGKNTRAKSFNSKGELVVRYAINTYPMGPRLFTFPLVQEDQY